MYKKIIHNGIWLFLDNPGRFIIISALWAIFSFIPLYLLLIFPDFFFFRIEGLNTLFRIPAFILILLYFPPSMHLQYIFYCKLKNQTPVKKLIIPALKKYTFKSALISILIFAVNKVVYFNISFYIKHLKEPFYIGYFISGMLFWLYLYFNFFLFFTLPLLIFFPEENFITTLKKSFLI
ncbi:MAG: hypothetical protein KAS39_02890, partial [Actinomycetia bacterium]|nr:hypothetical protein [Actinomycetes bacterium]